MMSIVALMAPDDASTTNPATWVAVAGMEPGGMWTTTCEPAASASGRLAMTPEPTV